jgi:hypothetical protein
MDAVFEGATINGKQFPFVRVTVAGGARIVRRLNPTISGVIFQFISFQWMRSSAADMRWWKKIRSVAFVKNGLWKVGIVPKELRCSEILLQDAWGIEKCFFDYAEVKVNAHGVLFISAKDSQTEINQEK